MYKSIPTTFETGNIETAKNATLAQIRSIMSEVNNYSTSNELDLKKAILSPKLRHDIEFDPNLHFRPNLDGEKGRKEHDEADVFWKAMISQLDGYLNDREKLKQDEKFTFSSEQVNIFINSKTFLMLYTPADFGFGTTCYAFPNDWFFDNSTISILSIIWVVVLTVCGKRLYEKISSKKPFDFCNLHSGI